MNGRETDELMHMSVGDRWLVGLFLPFVIPVVGATIWLVQKESTSTMLGWVVKWCVIEFLSVAFAFMVLLFLWAVVQAQWIAELLTSALRRLTRWLVSLFILAIIGNIVFWLFAPLLG